MKPCFGPLNPTLESTVSMMPSFGTNIWYQMTPAMTSDSTYGTKMIVRRIPWPRILRFSSSAMARPSGSWMAIDATTMIMLCWNASMNSGFSSTRR
ncbi:hypothetical protein CPER28S_02837 [Cellulomonas persica]